jgi:hypothetical protein
MAHRASYRSVLTTALLLAAMIITGMVSSTAASAVAPVAPPAASSDDVSPAAFCPGCYVGTIMIHLNEDHSFCLAAYDPNGSGTQIKNGDKVQIYKCGNGGPAGQRWRVYAQGPGSKWDYLVSDASAETNGGRTDYCLNAPTGNFSNGSPVDLQTCDGTNREAFSYIIITGQKVPLIDHYTTTEYSVSRDLSQPLQNRDPVYMWKVSNPARTGSLWYETTP